MISFIWKSINDFFFNGIRWSPMEIQLKEKRNRQIGI